MKKKKKTFSFYLSSSPSITSIFPVAGNKAKEDIATTYLYCAHIFGGWKKKESLCFIETNGVITNTRVYIWRTLAFSKKTNQVL